MTTTPTRPAPTVSVRPPLSPVAVKALDAIIAEPVTIPDLPGTPPPDPVVTVTPSDVYATLDADVAAFESAAKAWRAAATTAAASAAQATTDALAEQTARATLTGLSATIATDVAAIES